MGKLVQQNNVNQKKALQNMMEFSHLFCMDTSVRLLITTNGETGAGSGAKTANQGNQVK